MGRTCSFCSSRGEKGFFGYPKGPQRGECLELAGLTEANLKVKVESLRICFRHYKAEDFYFNDGEQLRLKKGNLNHFLKVILWRINHKNNLQMFSWLDLCTIVYPLILAICARPDIP